MHSSPHGFAPAPKPWAIVIHSYWKNPFMRSPCWDISKNPRCPSFFAVAQACCSTCRKSIACPSTLTLSARLKATNWFPFWLKSRKKTRSPDSRNHSATAHACHDAAISSSSTKRLSASKAMRPPPRLAPFPHRVKLKNLLCACDAISKKHSLKLPRHHKGGNHQKNHNQIQTLWD